MRQKSREETEYMTKLLIPQTTFLHLKRRHLSVVYVPVSILDAFFSFFLLTEEQQRLEYFQKLK